MPTQPVGEVLQPAGEVMDIPAVIDRPLEVDEGPRVAVMQFQLVDARDLPKFDVKLADLQAIVDAEKEKHPEGFTIGQLQEVADAVTRFYREKGLILAQGVIPVQSVQGGIVNIQVYEGRLGRVLAEGNLMYKEALLKIPFKGLIGEPITKNTIESALLQLTDFPGLTVFGVFQPGQQVGTADIVLRVQEEKRLEVAFRIDNQGLQDTGIARFRPVIEWNNVTATADRLTITVQQTYNPKNNAYQNFEYERFFGWGIQAGGYMDRNRFDVGGEFAAQDIFGQTEQEGLWIDKDWYRSRQFNFSSGITLERKEAKTLTRGRFTNRDKLSVLGINASLDHVDTRFKGINFATAQYTRGFNDIMGAMGSSASASEHRAGTRPSRQGGDGRFAAGQFDKLFLTASRLQTVRPNTSLLVRAEYQWSNDLLVPLEQYSIGGPDNVRAYAPAESLQDSALFFSAEIIQNMPFITDVRAFGNRTWGELVQISMFYDHAVGRLNDPLDTDPDGYINFKGAGVQVRFTLPGMIESRVMGAWRVGGNDSENERHPQVWGDLTYRF
jgi:hemolysin activation/secretion protein